MTCDKNNKKKTLRRTQGLTINQTTMMEMTSNEHKRNGNKQVLQEKNCLKQTMDFQDKDHKDILHGINRHKANNLNDM